jgi:hypothetical protein
MEAGAMNTNIKIVLVCVVMILAFTVVSMAGSERRIGTCGAQELRIPIGSRGTALGGAISADVYGTEAIFYNPAGVALVEGTEAMFSHLKYFADIDLNYFAITRSIEDFGSVGFSAKVLSVGKIDKTTEFDEFGTGEVFNPTMAVIGMTYSKILTDRVTFGVTGKYINESIDLASANGLAFDFGINYDTKWKGLRLGFVLNNIGPEMHFEGPGFDRDASGEGQNPGSPDKTFRSRSASFEIPSWLEFGAAFDFMNMDMNRASFYGAFQNNNFSKDLYRAGVEYAYNERYFARLGYTLDSHQEDYLYGFTVGGGLMVKIGETDVTFEYSWNQTEFFDNNQYFTGKINF